MSNKFNDFSSEGTFNPTDGSLDILGKTLSATNLGVSAMVITNAAAQLVTDTLLAYRVAGSTTEVQFNTTGLFDADSRFTFDTSNGLFTVHGVTWDDANDVTGLSGLDVNGVNDIQLVTSEASSDAVLIDATAGGLILRCDGVMEISTLSDDLTITGADDLTLVGTGGITLSTPGQGVESVGSILIALLPHGVAAGNTQELRFRELLASGTNSVGFKSPDAIVANITWTLPDADGAANQHLATSGAGILSWQTPGNVSGPISSTDNALPRFDGIAGDTLQNSLILVTDTGEMSGLNGLVMDAAASAIIDLTTGAAITIESSTSSVTVNSVDEINLTSSGDNIGITASGRIFLDSTGNRIETVAPFIQMNPFGVIAGNTQELRLLELAANGVNYVGFKSPDAIVANEVWILPDADGASGEFMVTDAANGLSFTSNINTAAAIELTSSANDIVLTALSGEIDIFTPSISLRPFGVAAGNTHELRFLELAASGSNYTGFKSPDALLGNVLYTLPDADGSAGFHLSTSGAGILSWVDGVVSTGASTDNALVRFDGATGNSIQNSVLTVDDSGQMSKSGSLWFHNSGGAGNTFAGLTSGAAATVGATSNTGYGNAALANLILGGDENSCFGRNAGTAIDTGVGNTCFGFNTGPVLAGATDNNFIGTRVGTLTTTGSENTIEGSNSFGSNISGSRNVGLGFFVMDGATGNQNTCVGYFSGSGLTSGEDNVFLGLSSGQNITTTDDNIIIGNLGVVGDAGIIRIGTSGTHTSAFISGIQGVTPAGLTTTETVLIDTATGELGSAVHAAYTPGHIDGLQVADATVSTKTIAVGTCRSDDDTFNIDVTGTLTPNITTSGANGLDTGVEAADTWYHIFVMADTAGVAAVASLLSLSSTAPTLPSPYDVLRLVGAVRNDGSSDFYDSYTTSTGRDRLYLWREDATTLEVLSDGAATTWADVDLEEFVPPASTLAYLQASHVGSSDVSEDHAAFRPNGSSVDGTARAYSGAAVGNSIFHLETDTAQLIEYQNNSASEETDVWVLGYTLSL